jgi:hypothetical protein
MLIATCHCGAVEIEMDDTPESVTQCTCSVCRRYAALWAFYTRSTARLTAGSENIVPYCWNDRVIEFFHCKVCGCLTHYEGIEKTPDERFAVNFRMLDRADIEGIKINTFDGADTWKILDA